MGLDESVFKEENQSRINNFGLGSDAVLMDAKSRKALRRGSVRCRGAATWRTSWSSSAG